MGNLAIDQLNEEASTFNESKGRIELDVDFQDMVKGFQKDFTNKNK